jgi:C-terminal processing protease CtpA/Prc
MPSMNRRAVTLLGTALVLGLAASTLPLRAGDSSMHKKCPYTTQDCLNHMAARMKTTGWVGIEYEMDDTTGVATVTRVVPASPAEKAGLQKDDVLFSLNGVEINMKNEDALMKARKEWKPGQTVNYIVKRNGQDRPIALTLGEMPADVLARFVGQHMLEHAEADAATPPPPPPAPTPAPKSKPRG